MTDVTSIMQTAYSELSHLSPLPWPIETLFHLFHQGHRMLEWKNLGTEIKNNQDNLAHCIAGGVLNLALGKQQFIHTSARLLLLTQRISEATKSKDQFFHAFRRWSDCLQGHYQRSVPLPNQEDIPQTGWLCYLSPSTALWIQITRTTWKSRISQVIICSREVFISMYQLSFHYMSITEVLSCSEHSRHIAVITSFKNTHQLIKQISSQKNKLVADLEQVKDKVDLTLRACNIAIEIDPFIELLKKSISIIESIDKKAQSTQQQSIEHAKDSLFTFFSLLGVQTNCFLPKMKLSQQILDQPRPTDENNPSNHETCKSGYESPGRFYPALSRTRDLQSQACLPATP